MRMREWLEQTLSHHSGRSAEEISRDIERDKYLSAQDALDYGLVDQVLASRKDSGASPAGR
jgi:ATP-dependent Clp protease protease subunit